jgi:hypothetical protein
MLAATFIPMFLATPTASVADGDIATFVAGHGSSGWLSGLRRLPGILRLRLSRRSDALCEFRFSGKNSREPPQRHVTRTKH